MDVLPESLPALALVCAGYYLGRFLGTRRNLWLGVGYLVPLAAILSLRLALEFPAFGMLPGVRQLAYGSYKYALMSLTIPLLLVAPAMRLKERWKQWPICVLGVVAAILNGALPLATPACYRNELTALTTRIDEDGIECEHRSFDSVDDLVGCCPAIVAVRFGPMVGHYVTVLAVDGTDVVIGDPISGRRRVPIGDFALEWYGTGVVVRRNTPDTKLGTLFDSK